MAINATNAALLLTPRADIAKCEGIGCAYSESCGRYLRPVAQPRQAWSAFYAMADDDCLYFEVPVLVAG